MNQLSIDFDAPPPEPEKPGFMEGGRFAWRCLGAEPPRKRKTEVPRQRARHTDPETSHEALAGITAGQPRIADTIVAALRSHGPQTTHELAERTGLSLVTVSPTIKPLRVLGLVDFTPDPDNPGKPLKRHKRLVWRAV